jgi:hypothetical protein
MGGQQKPDNRGDPRVLDKNNSIHCGCMIAIKGRRMTDQTVVIDCGRMFH